MTIRTHAAKRLMATSAAALALAWSHPVAAHCDTLDGPVVGAARRALDTGNVDLVLVWVQKDDEAEVLGHFQKTLAVRKLSPQARDLADMYFFETLVRLHRAGEGAGYTGGFNRSMQHTDRCVSSRSVADEVPHAHLLHRGPEGGDVGAMEARLDAAPDRAPV